MKKIQNSKNYAAILIRQTHVAMYKAQVPNGIQYTVNRKFFKSKVDGFKFQFPRESPPDNCFDV